MADTMTLHELRAALVDLFPGASVCAEAQCWLYKTCGEYVTKFSGWVDHGGDHGDRFEASTCEGVLAAAMAFAERNADNPVVVGEKGQ